MLPICPIYSELSIKLSPHRFYTKKMTKKYIFVISNYVGQAKNYYVLSGDCDPSPAFGTVGQSRETECIHANCPVPLQFDFVRFDTNFHLVRRFVVSIFFKRHSLSNVRVVRLILSGIYLWPTYILCCTCHLEI